MVYINEKNVLRRRDYMLEKYKDVLSVSELLEILPLGKNSIYKLIKDGQIKCIRVGARIIIPKKCVIDFLNSVEAGV